MTAAVGRRRSVRGPGERLDRLVERRHRDQPHRARVEAVELGRLVGGEEQHVGADLAGGGGLRPAVRRSTRPSRRRGSCRCRRSPARAARSSPEAYAYDTSATISPCDDPRARSRNHDPGHVRARRPPTATSSRRSARRSRRPAGTGSRVPGELVAVPVGGGQRVPVAQPVDGSIPCGPGRQRHPVDRRDHGLARAGRPASGR